MSSYEKVISYFPEPLQTVLNDNLFQDSSILIFATVISGGLNYLYQILMGRMLGPEQYGTFGALFGLFYILGIMGRGTGIITTRYISKHSEQEAKAFLTGFSRKLFALTGILFIVFALISPYIANFMKIDNVFLLMIVVATSLIGLINAINKSIARGLQKFVLQGSFGVSTALIKLTLGVGLVMAGFEIVGALTAPLVATLLVFAAGLFYFRSYYTDETDYQDYPEVYKYAIPALLGGFCMAVPANLDVILVKNMFSSTQAGLYTSVTVLGKIILFLPAGVVGALFPKVSENEENGGDSKNLLFKGLGFTALIAVSATVFYTLFPQILSILFGADYASISGLLPLYGSMITVFALAQTVLNYSLARHHTFYAKIFAALTVLEMASVYLVASTITQVVQIMLVFNAVIFLAGLLNYVSASDLTGWRNTL